ncbi:hypothetical protein MXB_1007 [Myxobolus squamalis]|nr:hypothetical protein MXB_1007 [Myxobolus squamalis]
MQVHRHTVKVIPNALPQRGDPDVEIYGTEGIPFIDIVARAKHKNVELVIKEKNIANAALPAKYERTLDAPYGTLVERAVKPGSPSATASNIQPILKSYYTPNSADGVSSTPGDYSRSNVNGYADISQSTYKDGPAKIVAEKIILPTERCRIYHPLEDISLEEHRLRFTKYATFQNKIAAANKPLIATVNQIYQSYPYPYFPGAYPPYPYLPQPPFPPQDFAIPPPGIPFPTVFQQPMFPAQFQHDPNQFQAPSNYYPQ